MEQIEESNDLKNLYSCTKKQPIFVDVPELNFLMFDGKGHPAEEDFQLACEALFTISYIIKFKISRKKLDVDYKVNPMEVLWNLEKGNNKILFSWTMMIRQPDFVNNEVLDEAIQIALRKLKKIEHIRLYLKKSTKCKCIQAFHLGEYNKMNETLEKMISLAKSKNLDYKQCTHDIYLNDSRKTKPENLKTIMRLKVFSKKQLMIENLNSYNTLYRRIIFVAANSPTEQIT